MRARVLPLFLPASIDVEKKMIQGLQCNLFTSSIVYLFSPVHYVRFQLHQAVAKEPQMVLLVSSGPATPFERTTGGTKWHGCTEHPYATIPIR